MAADTTLNGQDHDSIEDIYAASSIAEIRATLSQLVAQEAVVTARLDALVASQRDLSRQLTRLDLARAHVGSQAITARTISNGMLSSAASTATRISSAVNKLDREQTAVKATLEVVEQVAELKACVQGIHGSMGAAQDWETAASYLHRAAQIPDEVIDGAFAEEIVPTADIPDPPRVTLHQAAESLCVLFLREFNKAAQESDGARVTRFFKLFPLIGRSPQGLEAYGRYVCTGVATRARSNLNTANNKSSPLFYASALTKLFEQIAQIIDGHEALVERHYGAGMMDKVMERLQTEADMQAGIILDTWADDRNISKKLTEVKSYAFSFLLQSFLPAQKATFNRSNSPAGRSSTDVASDDESVDMKEVDALLGEIAMMLSRWALYTRFIATKIHHTELDAVKDTLAMPPLLSNSVLQRKITQALADPFNVMSTFFVRRSVEKAFQLDEQPQGITLSQNKPMTGNPPFITSAVDDVMYIINQVITRTLATSQRSVVANVIPAVGRVLGGDFFGMIQRKMRDECYPKAAIQGMLPPESIIISFLVLVNNLDVSTDYLGRIVNDNLGKQTNGQTDASNASRTPIRDLFPFGHDAVFVENALSSMLHAFESKTNDLIVEAIEVLLKQVTRPRLRPVLLETFRDVDYMPDEFERHGDMDGDENAVMQRFERGWMAFALPLKRVLTERNYDRLIGATTAYLGKALEKRIWSYYGRVNALGAVRMERDVSGIVAAAVKGGRYGLRDAFARCIEMTLILNMEDDEWDELVRNPTQDEGMVWHLDAGERQRTRGIVTDTA